MGEVDQAKIETLITRWSGLKGGAERKNFAPFILEMITALDLPPPEPGEGGRLGDYEFEGTISGGSAKLSGAGGNADLYKRGCFVMEAKQSLLKDGERSPELPGFDNFIPITPSGASYDRLMIKAQAQAKNYAHNLPDDHPRVPFLIVCDVGRAFELFFDYAGVGRNYGFFPDAKSYRIPLQRLREPDVQALFRDIWTNPAARDPKLQSAKVTRLVASDLAQVSRHLEEEIEKDIARRGGDRMQLELAIEESSLFLMRMLFCMFAEDIGLLPERGFTKFLKSCVTENGEGFVVVDYEYLKLGLRELWDKMNRDGPDRAFTLLRGDVRYFNGGLFENNNVLSLSNTDVTKLIDAAERQWRSVEPAIFGTLLEQALSTQQRAQLGAHYTPRAYVERLVDATIMDVLNAEWTVVQDRLTDPLASADEQRTAAATFHDRLAKVTVLDPACGTGNFLYVAMEAIERLEAQVIEARRQLGEDVHSRITPAQFLGLEKNPRAAKIAELVLWIGWLRFRIDNDPASIIDPVLRRGNNINFGRPGGYDAVLDELTGLIPDWPEAEFIVGNPPFIGKGSFMRAALGSEYVETLWAANARVPASADFVMQWWDRAAITLVTNGTRLQRFGFVTTNSITQSFSRRVIEAYQDKLSLTYAIADHPWTRSTAGAAAVRIAMTVAQAGQHDGCVAEVVREAALDSDTPTIEVREVFGPINADLSVGTDVTTVHSLEANRGLSSNGMMLAGQGFKITPSDAALIRKLDGDEDGKVVKPYVGGIDLLRRGSVEYIIDFGGLSEKSARSNYPASYQHVLTAVKPQRDKSADKAFRERWWVFGRVRPEIRAFNAGLIRYIGTTETSKHRVFQFLDSSIVPDHMVIAIGSDDASLLGALSSSIHAEWSLRVGGWLGFGNDNRYNKSKVFDPFPFPDASPELRTRIGDLAEELDATRKLALAEVSRLTMTEIYNLRAKFIAGTLTPAEDDRAVAARAKIVAKLHDDLDAAVAEAYGWEWPLAPAEIVTRLVTLNAERAAEEAAGHVRWLRPDYQKPRFDKTPPPK